MQEAQEASSEDEDKVESNSQFEEFEGISVKNTKIAASITTNPKLKMTRRAMQFALNAACNPFFPSNIEKII